MDDHLDIVDKAGNIMTLLKKEASFADMSKDLAILKKSGCEIPLCVQTRLLAARLKDMVVDLNDPDECELEVFVSALSPFAHSASMTLGQDSVKEEVGEPDGDDEHMSHRRASGDHTPFDPLEPRMCDVDLSLEEKLELALKILVRDVARPCISKGEDGVDTAINLSKAIERIWVGGVEDMEDVPQAAADTLTIFRYLRSIADTTTTDIDFDSITMVVSSAKSHKKTILQELADIVENSDEWRERRLNLTKTLTSAQALLPQIAAKAAALPTPTATHIAEGTMEKLHAAFAQIKMARAVLRTGSTHVLEVKARNVLDKVIEGIQGAAENLPKMPHEKLVALQELLCSAIDVWGDASHRQFCEALMAEIAMRDKSKTLGGILNSIESAVDHNNATVDFGKLRSVSDSIAEQDSVAFDGEQASKCLSLCKVVYQNLVKSFPDCVGGSDVLASMLKLCSGVGVEAQKVLRQVQALAHGGRLSSALDAHKKLADDLYARVANDEDNMKIKLVMVANLNLKESLQSLSDEPPACLRKVSKDAEAFINEVADMTINPVEKKFAFLVDSVASWARGGKNSKNWFEGAPDDASIENILAMGKKTILSRPIETYIEKKNEIAAAHTKYEETSMLFSRTPAPAMADTRDDITANLHLTYIEGLLVALYSKQLPRDQWKSKTHGIKRMLSPNMKWSVVHPSLRERADKATKMLS